MRTYLLFAIWICATICACGSFSGTTNASTDTNDGGANTNKIVAASDGSTNPETSNSTVDAGNVDDDASDDASTVDSDDAGLQCEGGGPYTHSAGVASSGTGEATWTDCVPVGTHNQTQAGKACAAYNGTGSCAGYGQICPTGSTCPSGCDSEYGTFAYTSEGMRWWFLSGAITKYNVSCSPVGNWN
jgi:hypothetical protein